MMFSPIWKTAGEISQVNSDVVQGDVHCNGDATAGKGKQQVDTVVEARSAQIKASK
jgi:hypothetical protein